MKKRDYIGAAIIIAAFLMGLFTYTGRADTTAPEPVKPIVFYASGYHHDDYAPLEHPAVNETADVWLHNPWGQDKPMSPDQWFRRQAEGWRYATTYSPWEAFCDQRRANGFRTFIHIGNPHLVPAALWPRYAEWLRWAGDTFDGISFDSSEEVVAWSDQHRLLMEIDNERRAEVIIEPAPLASHTHLHEFATAMSARFYRSIERPAGRWQQTVRGRTYVLLVQIRAADEVEKQADELIEKGIVPVVPVKFWGGD